MFDSIISKYLFAGFKDATCRVTFWYVSKGTKREISFKFGTMPLHKLPPHQTPCRIIREREVNLFIKELFEFFLWAFLGLTRTTNYCDSCFIIYVFCPPFSKWFLYSLWISRIILFAFLLTLFLAFLLGWPYFFTLVNVYVCWLVELCRYHYWSYELVFFFFGLIDVANINRT